MIWALGYHDSAAWLNIAEAVAGDGRYIEDRGVSPVPGLFYIGRDWQNNRASALLAGGGNDAADIANRAIAFVQTRKAKARSAIG